MNRRLISTLLLFALVMPYVLIPVLLRYEIKQIRREIKHHLIEGLDRSQLVELTLGPQQQKHLKWEHAGEFEYKGEWYDVVETQVANGKTTYWCWWDHEETSLSKRLKGLLAGFLQKKAGDGDDESFSFLTALYDLPVKIFISERPLADARQGIVYLASYSDPDHESGGPPPWRISFLT